MNSAARWNRSDSVWLAAALAAHALLLLIPVDHAEKSLNRAATIRLRLNPIASRAAADPELKTVRRESLGPDQTIPPARPEELPAREKPDDSENLKANITPLAVRNLSAALMLEIAATAGLDTPVPRPPRQLGVPDVYRIPANWQRSAGAAGLPSDGGLLSGMAVPGQTQIQDRWLAPDGSHQVVLELPGGQTVCGRAEAWNPLQPLVEHVMLFRNCGGGGKRTFSMNGFKPTGRTGGVWAENFD